MGNWCAVHNPEPESPLPISPLHFPLRLEIGADILQHIQNSFLSYLLCSRLKRQQQLLPLSADPDPFPPVFSPYPAPLPRLSDAAEARKQEFADFEYDLPSLLLVTEMPAVRLSDESAYVGEWYKGKRYGRGVCYKDGGILEGYWVSGFLHHKGRIIYSDGSSYEGGFDLMRRHGHGQFMSRDGQEVYTGNWEYGVKHGKGTETLGDVTYRGWFDRAERTGESVVLEWRNGDRYEGAMVRGMKHGYGTYVWSSGEEYVGNWVEDRKEGTGLWKTEGKEYAGHFKNGVQQGIGFLKWSNFEYHGEFDAGTMHGEGWLSINGNRRRFFRFNRNKRGPELSTETHLPLHPQPEEPKE